MSRRGGGRNWRRGGDRYASSFGSRDDKDDSPAGSSRQWGRGAGRGGRPPGLRGKEIGMYYAKLNKKKQEKEERENIKKLSVRLDEQRQQQIWKLLSLPDNNQQTSSSASCDTANFENKLDVKYSHIADSAFKRRFLQNVAANERAALGPTEVLRNALTRDTELDKKLQNELKNKQNDRGYISMQADRSRLPAHSKKEEILQILKDNQVVVISGETGCGKTTQVAQFILDDAVEQGNGSLCRIVCTQPRRISAISIAHRVADERCEQIGGLKSVGYQIRLESRLPRERGSILYCTTGILIQWLQSDPCLEKISHLIVDEIHERDTLSDFVLTIMKELLPHRPDMKLILMSATLNAQSFSKYYDNCPMLNIPGMTYPVEKFYLEDVLEMTGYRFSSLSSNRNQASWKKHTSRGRENEQKKRDYLELMEPYVRKLKSDRKYSQHVLDSLLLPESEEMNLDLIARLVQHTCNTKPDGAILVFLPGWDQISKLYTQLTETSFFSKDRYRILPLHSAMPTVNQREIFQRPPRGVRKIVIATNIAETSITIDDVVYVVDCGRIKMKNFDVERNIQTLQPEWVSLANAVQRRGRAGRVQPGVCYHLFSRRREMTLDSYPLPEMLRSRLEEVILQLKILKLGLVRPFLEKVLDPPNPLAVDHSIKLLETLNAVDEEESLTPLGFHLAQLPMDPQIGKMLLMGALFRCLDPVLSVAASLSHKDAFTLPLGSEDKANAKKEELSLGLKSDHLVFAEAMRRWEQAELNRQGREFCWDYFLSGSTLVFLRSMKSQFAEHLRGMNFISTTDPKASEVNINSSNRSLVKAIVCAGLYPNVAIVKKVKRNFKSGRTTIILNTPEDGRVELHPKSVNSRQSEFESPLMLYHLKLKSSAVYLHDTTMVHPLPLLFFGGGLKSVTDEFGESHLSMDSLQFSCKKDTSTLIKELRKRLDHLLEHKITHPQVVNWDTNSTERALLQAIVELITTEDKHYMLVPDHYSSDSD